MTARILVCDDEAGLREMLGVLLRRSGYAPTLCGGVVDAVALIADQAAFDVVITDLAMPDGSGMEVLDAAQRRDGTTQIVMITAFATTAQAVEAMRKGAYDYVQKPFKNDALLATIDKALEKRAIVNENRSLRATLSKGYRRGDLLGKSEAMQRIMALIERVAASRTSVLITGESGTGKEMVARALHQESDRKDGPFIAVNCGALPESLMESELFGHEKGAFTGAQTKKEGLIRAAEGGTLFLDEIGELPASLQVKLLRVLQERKVRPVGSEREQDIDVRIVAATNRDIDNDVREGTFRQDLYYRLNVIHLHVPPLRDRLEDVPILAEHFLAKHGALAGKRLTYSPLAMRWIVAQPYPGNVRELENVVERAVTMAIGDTVQRDDLPQPARDSGPPKTPLPAFPEGDIDLDGYLATIERHALEAALERAAGVRTHAAELLGLSFRSFRYRLAKYGLGDEDGDGGSDPAGDDAQ